MKPRSLGTDGFSLVETLVVVGLIGIVSAIAVPSMGDAVGYFRLSGDARSVSNAVALSKLRAASDFSRVRLYVDLAAKTHHLESFNKTNTTCCWILEGGNTALSTNISFGYGPITNEPPSTQGAIGQAALCKDDSGADIANTACVIFNSRGTPITSGGASTPDHAVYVTDGKAVYGVTVSATGMSRTWRANSQSTATWVLQ